MFTFTLPYLHRYSLLFVFLLHRMSVMTDCLTAVTAVLLTYWAGGWWLAELLMIVDRTAATWRGNAATWRGSATQVTPMSHGQVLLITCYQLMTVVMLGISRHHSTTMVCNSRCGRSVLSHRHYCDGSSSSVWMWNVYNSAATMISACTSHYTWPRWQPADERSNCQFGPSLFVCHYRLGHCHVQHSSVATVSLYVFVSLCVCVLMGPAWSHNLSPPTVSWV